MIPKFTLTNNISNDWFYCFVFNFVIEFLLKKFLYQYTCIINVPAHGLIRYRTYEQTQTDKCASAVSGQATWVSVDWCWESWEITC